jgi:hypothetical protein
MEMTQAGDVLASDLLGAMITSSFSKYSYTIERRAEKLFIQHPHWEQVLRGFWPSLTVEARPD